jgi:hypothetical protein
MVITLRTMEGGSEYEYRSALLLCLRRLREQRV